MDDHVNISTQDPAAYQALLELNKAATASAVAAGIDILLVELVKIRASQLNGCAFCLRMHVRDALRHGETPDRLAVLPAWRESGYFSDKERAALELAEWATAVGSTRVEDEQYARLGDALSAAEFSAVAWLATVINAFNRVAVLSRYEVAP
ncbi:carboxymuconolactone decarboxylase family protein [Specibacter cremeus]|uniref:carboxymuconolactone decarboxylase family protein n=1 Tax=Specibacter cremeus TaxID=1629051 RepID=UPI000F792DCE|nr:carboxymuconolactone decarboxylase family protein [Specibacter cremeus]